MKTTITFHCYSHRTFRASLISLLSVVVLLGGLLLSINLHAAKIPVILDTDIGDDIDDTWALAFLLRSPELDLKLVVGDQGKSIYRAKIIAKLLETAGRTDVPVGVGLNVNAQGEGAQQAWVKDYNLDAYPGVVHRDGVQALIDTIMKSPEPITLIAIGPLPNVAAALEREPGIARKARFVGMHGSVRLGYNGKKSIDPEWNVRADVKACQKVFTAAWPMTITPLDTCGLIVLSGDRYRKVYQSQDPLARAVIENYMHWSQNKDVVKERSSTLFDTVAVYLAWGRDLVIMEELGVRVDDEGFTRIDPAAKSVNVATAWNDQGGFEDLLVQRITTPGPSAARRLPLKQYVDRMKAGWIGQMAGVGWGGPTEFHWKGEIIPADKMPVWKPEMINQFEQDDLYVEMTFLRTLEQYGFAATPRQAGVDFAQSGYQLWHANKAGRDNLRKGIVPPDSGHPRFNAHADDIDYQIEADFSGLISPGLPNQVLELGETFGRLMNYGDGLYGGLFVGGMYAEAFFEKDIATIIRAGLQCVPVGSQFHECISDVRRWHQQYPDDWTKTWNEVNKKYHLNPAYRRFSCTGPQDPFNIDAKINAAYIVIGLLYGGGDLDQTITIATRCGQDSDCNPSNAAGVLATTMGFARLPERFKSALDPNGHFSHTPYTFPKLIEVCEQLALQAVQRAGGRVETDQEGNKILVIPIQAPNPGALEQCWQPRS